jgi:hypothetical protein
MRRIWVYQGDLGWGKDFKWMSVAEFERTFSIGQAAGFLGQIEKTLRNEALDRSERGLFYTGFRHVFAEIDGLGKLYVGERGTQNTVENAIAFAREFLGRVNPRYRDLYGLLVDMYRHGLAHTHLTKSFRFRDSAKRWITTGWAITDGKAHRNRHLTVEQREARFFRLWLHVPKLVHDTLKAIKEYRSDLEKEGVASTPFRRFKVGYIGTAAVFQEPVAPSPAGKPPKKRPRKHALTLKQYSAEGLAWLQHEISSGSAWKDNEK